LFFSSLNLVPPEVIDRPFYYQEISRNFYDEGFVKTFISREYDIPAITNKVIVEVWEPPPV
jgi:glycogen synthase